MVSPEVIKEFLEGTDPEKYIVAVEFDYQTDAIYKIKEHPKHGKVIERDRFTPFAWVGNMKDTKFYNGSKALQKQAMSRHGIMISKLDSKGNERLENGFNFLVKSLKGYRSLIQFFRDGGIDPWSEKGKENIIVLPPAEQFLVATGKRLFKGFESYDDITRFAFDLETTSLEPKDGRIFMIGMRTNKGFTKIIECSNEEEEKKGLVEFFKTINEIKPTIITGHNIFNFDFPWIYERCKALGLEITSVAKTLNPTRNITQSEKILKLANEVEKYNHTTLWGYNIIDTLHSVRRAQAINSNIKSASLKYITKFIDAESADRVYIPHGDIGSMYQKKEEYWLNITNGEYRKVKENDEPLDIQNPSEYKKVTGDILVEMYLEDDLDETLIVDEEFNQASFLLSSLVPTTYERISTMGTATLWEMEMRAWSYQNNLAIPEKLKKTNFVGGLSRLIKVGYSKNVVKFDYSSLYPSIQLVHDVFPKCDVTGVMKGMLSYFRNARIEYKELAEKYQSIDPKKSKSYDTKQLPIKIFINSMFGALSAPQVFHWGDMDEGEMITCTGRQYLRQMIKFFMKKGYTPLVMDTDGINFSTPDDVWSRTYVGLGLNWKVEKGKKYEGYFADIAEFNDVFMRGEMALDLDGEYTSCINIARKNYAILTKKGKVKLTGNSIKSKKIPEYIEDFLDVGIDLLLNGDGQGFVNYYYEYIEKVYNKQIPLRKIASKARVKVSVEDYIRNSKKKTKSGASSPKQAHMELIIREGIPANLGDMIYYVNNGTAASHGDVQKMGNEVQINSYLLNKDDIDDNPDKTGEYNVPRAIVTLNKRISPLLVVFKDEVRDNLLVKSPEEFNIFTKEQCELINGVPLKHGDQDDINEILQLSDEEVNYWERVGRDPNHIYNVAMEGWESYL